MGHVAPPPSAVQFRQPSSLTPQGAPPRAAEPHGPHARSCGRGSSRPASARTRWRHGAGRRRCAVSTGRTSAGCRACRRRIPAGTARGRRREDIDDAAARRKLAGLQDKLRRREAALGQPGPEARQAVLLADHELDRIVGEMARRRNRLHEGLDRRDEERGKGSAPFGAGASPCLAAAGTAAFVPPAAERAFGRAAANALSTRSRSARILSENSASVGSASHAGKTAGSIPAKSRQLSHAASTESVWART